MLNAILLLPFLLQGTSYDGATLIAPLSQHVVNLVDDNGTIVHSWPGSYTPGLSAYLTPEFNLIRTLNIPTISQQLPAGHGGGLQLMDWGGNVIWDYQYLLDATLPTDPPVYLQHHDIEWLPNGNVLLVAWERKTAQAALNAGRDPALLNPGTNWFLPDYIVELEPVLPGGANIVWEWHIWDHLIQDFNSALPNYGVVANHPELININYPPLIPSGDWNHVNTVSYNEDLDQVMLTSRHLNELWVIDHSTTTAEAEGNSGGNHGMGGDLLYRWGNPQAYGRGTAADQMLFGPHDAQWIAPNRLGAGNIIMFDNGLNNPAGAYSIVYEIVPPITATGNYSIPPGGLLPYGPTTIFWQYPQVPSAAFYSPAISGCERLPNDNTLICSGNQGLIFEVNTLGTTIWASSFPYDIFKARKYGVTDPPRSICFGSGSGTACPCGNSGSPGEGCANSTGQGAILSSSGSPRILNDTLTLEISQGTANQPVLFFQGNNAILGGNGITFGDGLRCCGGGVKRLQIRFMDFSGSASSTASLSAAGATSVGDILCYQGWYRDPNNGPCSNSFNLTNALSLTWVP